MRSFVAAQDVTGREDAVEHLRNKLLLRLAAAHGATKVAKGDTAATIAVRVIADLSKGRGYSLPSDIQMLDTRHGDALPAGAPKLLASRGGITAPAV